MTFYEDLLAKTAVEREALLSLPIVRAGAMGQISLDSYVAFLTEAYHHVKHTLPLLMACGAKIPGRIEWLRTGMAEYIGEEIGHHEWILNDIAACGENPDVIRHGAPSFETELMVAYAYDTIARGNPVGFLGMVLVLEGTSVQIASNAARAIQDSLKLPDAAFTYLTSHGALDIGHTAFYETLVNRLDDEFDRKAVIHCARVFYRLYADIFRFLQREIR
ncbi:MAG: iron-containing redox enzyme family protein [Burkholderiales bacterium]|nr:iron-containing redox enzyme family protein [Burkholderiales bacterium]